MGRLIVLNDAARTLRPRAALLARRRHQLHIVGPSSEADVTPRPSTADKVEKVVWVVALWALFIAYIVVLTPPDFGRSVVRFQSQPIQIASPSASTDVREHVGAPGSPRFYAAIR